MGQKGVDVILKEKAQERFKFAVECFSGDTLIVTKEGMKPISDIQINDKVLTHLGRFKKVTSTSKRRGFLGALRTDFKTTPILVTAEHKFEDIYKNWISVNKIITTIFPIN